MAKKSKGITDAERFARSGGRMRKDLDRARAGSSLSRGKSTQFFNQGVNESIDRTTGTKSVPAKFKKRKKERVNHLVPHLDVD